ncbi:MAG: DUF429 domain-containing protein, partial [Dehalococcoidia bacterium]|nr:DUF429 domain-containing protein [Dehalococcoidia bacterium]
ALEVFPHAAIVALLGSSRALRYKKGPLGLRLEALGELRTMLGAYLLAECPELLTSPLGDLLREPFGTLRGREMKEIEDRLDAVTCALSAHHIWRHGEVGTRVFGDAASGYIAVPVAVVRD